MALSMPPKNELDDMFADLLGSMGSLEPTARAEMEGLSDERKWRLIMNDVRIPHNLQSPHHRCTSARRAPL